ncbi:MAG: hypothetical protein ACQEVA_23675 [Myxococcota bacterium]
MEISTAHIFYIVMILAVGALAGYFVGRRSAEADMQRQRKRKRRRKALRDKARQASETAERDEERDEAS